MIDLNFKEYLKQKELLEKKVENQERTFTGLRVKLSDRTKTKSFMASQISLEEKDDVHDITGGYETLQVSSSERRGETIDEMKF